jgi:diaminohydroxyphosphoribosylaminopyrimidine deaminase/5-amino-6-(5-phosphoribosylamino)uracil reductase
VVPATSAGVLLPEAVYRRALVLGREVAGLTGPNPPVGCVIVRDGVIVGEGATGPVGSAHAEVRALHAAGEAARGATAIVTLEPCAHHGRTPPCVDALVESGVEEVHVLHHDPDPIAAGGIDRLRSLGVTVLEVGRARPDLGAEAEHDLRGFIARVRAGRPHVTLKIAQTPDGRTAPPQGGYLTGLQARTRVHALRAASDAVLVGSATIAADDPRLDVRHVEATRSPRPVIFATTGGVDPSARAIRPGTIVVVGAPVAPAARAALEAAGATVLTVPRDVRSPEAHLDASAALSALLAERVLTVLAEPGPRLGGALLRLGLVDIIELHVAGGSSAPARIRPAFAGLEEVARRAEQDGVSTEDGDLIVRVVVDEAGLDVGRGEVA